MTFLNLVSRSGAAIACAADISPRKQGRYVPGAGQRVVSPEELADYSPELVVVMNPMYRDEILERLRAVDLHPEIVLA